MKNPIIDNRFINDYTFAVRFKQFLDWIPKNWWNSQPHYYEEFKYMRTVAEKLLKYQIKTATNASEIKYFKQLGFMITGNELFKDLETLKHKAEFVEITNPGNEIWKEVNSKLEEIVQLIKSDKRMYKW